MSLFLHQIHTWWYLPACTSARWPHSTILEKVGFSVQDESNVFLVICLAGQYNFAFFFTRKSKVILPSSLHLKMT